MVKHFGTLASRVLRTHQEVVPCLMRIQSGFMADQNIHIAEKALKEMQETLREMRLSLTAHKQQPIPTYYSTDFKSNE